MSQYPYLHMTGGRLRVKLPSIKGDEADCRRLEHILSETAGVTRATANPLTANLLVIFDPAITSHQHVLSSVEMAGFANCDNTGKSNLVGGQPAQTTKRLTTVVTNHLMQAAVQAAVERLIAVLI